MLTLNFYLYSAAVVGLVLLASACYFFVRLHRERLRCASEIAQSGILRESVNLKLQRETQENARLENEVGQLQQQIRLSETRSEMQDRRIAAQELFLESRNAQIEQILITLRKYDEIKGNRILSGQIRDLMALIKGQEHWKHFFEHFEHVNNQMLTRLWNKHPNLLQNDLRYVSYIYMNLSAKEISAILNISHEASRKRHERIRAKLGLPNSVSIMEYLAAV